MFLVVLFKFDFLVDYSYIVGVCIDQCVLDFFKDYLVVFQSSFYCLLVSNNLPDLSLFSLVFRHQVRGSLVGGGCIGRKNRFSLGHNSLIDTIKGTYMLRSKDILTYILPLACLTLHAHSNMDSSLAVSPNASCSDGSIGGLVSKSRHTACRCLVKFVR